MSSDGEVGVKIVIERHANPARLPRTLKDLDILRRGQPDLTHMDCLNAALRQQDGGPRRQSLIEQNRDQATRSIPRLSSSTAAAA
jgi:hypothetical protein